MNATIAMQMFGADFLKLRKKRGTLLWALGLAFAPLVIFFVANGLQNSSPSFTDGLNLLTRLFGLLAAILVGVEAGTSDASTGVFRDLVVTGRSRLALFASRVPAGVAMCWLVILGAYLLLVLGTFVLSVGGPTPDAALIFNALGFTLLSTGVVCVVAVGFASLTTSKPGAIIALIAWQIIASPLIVAISSLGSARDGALSQALVHYSPVRFEGGHHGGGTILTMSGTTALLVLIAWLVVFLALGAWRTRTMDA